MRFRTGQATLVDKGLAVLVFVIVLGAVGIPVVQDALVLDTVSVTNETQSPSSPFTFDELTLDEAADGVVDNDRLAVFALEQDTDTTTLLPDANVTVLPDSTAPDLNVTTGSDVINSSDDRYNVTYDGKPQGFVGGTAGTVLGFITVMLALALFVVAISMVRG